MKHIAFVSGKGGTGKSTLVASLHMLVENKMLLDCDVDAPNLHILFRGDLLKQEDYYGAKEAVLNPELCIKCGKCREVCRFDAINEHIEIIPMKCEGCGACTLVCPVNAVCLEDVKTGETYVTRTTRGTFAHALLDIGAEGSGKLVTEVRKEAGLFKGKEDWVLIDGSPGIGCAVIASITGCSAVVAVAEPTKSGLSDLKRVLGVARHFKIPGYVCINKYDLNTEITDEIETYCKENGFPVIGRIPFDQEIVKALQELRTPVENGNERVTKEIISIWNQLKSDLTAGKEQNKEN